LIRSYAPHSPRLWHVVSLIPELTCCCTVSAICCISFTSSSRLASMRLAVAWPSWISWRTCAEGSQRGRGEGDCEGWGVCVVVEVWVGGGGGGGGGGGTSPHHAVSQKHRALSIRDGPWELNQPFATQWAPASRSGVCGAAGRCPYLCGLCAALQHR
jgi:hypothetical protein